VVAGYYYSLAETPFEQAVTPYALVMPDRVNAETFLPATRSMLLPTAVWQQVGRFDVELSDNEDYAFAQELVAAEVPIVFSQSAQVGWQPRSTLGGFWKMIYRFARGDAYAGIWRPKVGVLFLRYLVGALLVLAATTHPILWLVIIAALLAYVAWSISKNYRYVPDGRYWLPVLQLVSDVAVMVGTIMGIIRRIGRPT
jgi:hypothetical protein